MGACTSILPQKDSEHDNKNDFPNPFLLLLRDYLSVQDRERARSVNSRWYTIFSDAKPSLRLYSVKATVASIQCTSGSSGILRDFVYHFDPNQKHLDKKALRIKSERTLYSILRNVKWIDHVSLQCLNLEILTQFHDAKDKLKFSIGYLDIHISKKLDPSILEVYLRKFVEVARHRVHIYIDPGFDAQKLAAYQRSLFSAFCAYPVSQELWVLPNELLLYSLEEIGLQNCPPRIECKSLDITLSNSNRTTLLVDWLFPKGILALLEGGIRTMTVSAGGWKNDEETENAFWNEELKAGLIERVQKTLDELPNSALSEIKFRKYCPHQEAPLHRAGQIIVAERCTVYFMKLKCFPDKEIY